MNIENEQIDSFESRQVVDIPIIKSFTIEHRVHSKTCRCGKTCKPSFPDSVSAPIQYGPGVDAMVSYLSVRQYIPFQRLQECFSAMFDLNISQGTLVNSLTRFSNKSIPLYQRIKENILSSPVIGADETGIKIGGKKGWFWVWQSAYNTFIQYNSSRGFDAIDNVFENGFKNSVLVSDCWAAQLKTKSKQHQLCTAHLLRELNFFIETDKDDKWSKEFRKLIKDALVLKANTIEYEIENPQRHEIQSKLNQLHEIEKRSSKAKLQAFQKRMVKNKDYILAFLYNQDIPPDNNASERAIRNVKVKQKVSGQFLTEQKAQEFAIIRSVIDTLIKNKVNIFDSLKLISIFSAE